VIPWHYGMMQDRQICKLVHIYSNPRFIVPPCHIAHPELRRRGDGVAGAPFPLSPAPLSALVAAHLCGHQAPPPGPPPVPRPGPRRRSDPRSNSNSKFNETPKENFLADIKPYPSPRLNSALDSRWLSGMLGPWLWQMQPSQPALSKSERAGGPRPADTPFGFPADPPPPPVPATTSPGPGVGPWVVVRIPPTPSGGRRL